MSKLPPRLSLNDRIADENGKPTPTFLRYYNSLLDALAELARVKP